MAEMKIESKGGRLRVQLRGRLDVSAVSETWDRLRVAFEHGESGTGTSPGGELDVHELDYLDGAGATLLTMLRRDHGFEVAGLPSDLTPMLELFDVARLESSKGKSEPSWVESIGQDVARLGRDIRNQVGFLGELILVSLRAIANPQGLRWRDALRVAERAGVNALPIVCLIGFLLGLVLSFQSAMMMRQFGAEVFVADLIGLSMVRELGPLMTAIVLAGRSGSAFAAELGTMKIREEVDALATMALDPVRFLVLPRMVAAIAMTPFLVLFCNFAALSGGAIVLMSLDYPLVTFIDRVDNQLTLTTYFIGLLKSVVFAMLVASVGCFRGLGTGRGAAAVGESTTSSVVTSIVLVAIADAAFSIVFYVLDV